MDCSKTEAYIKEKFRMCYATEDCDECELNDSSCGREDCDYPTDIKKAIAAVQKWSDEHPLKTYAQDFLEKLPNAQKDNEGTPSVCRARCYGTKRPNGCGERGCSCSDCWNEPMEGN